MNLPHTPRLEALVTGADGSDSGQWQGICWYRKEFPAIATASEKTILLELGAAMRTADVWLNGKWVGRHVGGYLPVVLDIGERVKSYGTNVLAVRLNNYDNPLTGPKPLSALDYNFYGGLYRSARLIVKDRLHITHPLHANKVAGGRVFITFPEVGSGRAIASVKTHVVNARPLAASVRVRASVQGRSGDVIASGESAEFMLDPGSDRVSEQRIEISNPSLWSPDNPNLYSVRTELLSGNEVIDTEVTRVGIRDVKITREGLTLNGKETRLRGVNRHQEHPYLGYALSPNAEYRDAKRIKEAGFDFVRLSHYPQSPAFLDACDELGLLVMNSIMGWQYFVEDKSFLDHQYKQCRELIRRDRNHPCVLLWEVSLNESPMSDEFVDKAHEIAHQEYPGDQCYTAGWQGSFDVLLQARQHGGCTEIKDKPCIVSEYGDWEYYAQNAGFEQDKWNDLQPAERNSRQGRSDGSKRLMQQALNFQQAHNDNLATSAFADALWVMYDYNRGYSNDLEKSAAWISSVYRSPPTTSTAASEM